MAGDEFQIDDSEWVVLATPRRSFFFLYVLIAMCLLSAVAWSLGWLRNH
ncbi:hypothetical protein [Stratiformator vulcanicus]|nr:hypothetical protein [Stratiformator vulcanicus]